MYYIDYQYICAVIINEMQDTQSIAEKDARIAELEAELEKRDTKIATLESQQDWLRKKVFGKMSEKCLPENPMEEPTLFDDVISELESAAIDVQKAKDEEVVTRNERSQEQCRRALGILLLTAVSRDSGLQQLLQQRGLPRARCANQDHVANLVGVCDPLVFVHP